MYGFAAFMDLSLELKGLPTFFFFLTKNRQTEKGREEISSNSSIIQINHKSLFYAYRNQNSFVTVLCMRKIQRGKFIVLIAQAVV